MSLSRQLAVVAAAAAVVALACAGRTGQDGPSSGGQSGGGGAGNSSAQGGMGALGGSTCSTAEGVRLCRGEHDECGFIEPSDCPGGGCERPYDRELKGDAVAGLCFSDLPDNASRPCFACEDGEVCIERKPGQLYCVPESVCARLWLLGARGVCRYTDLAAYDARPLPVLASCPTTETALCGGPCKPCFGDVPTPCTGRSPDHPQGFCAYYIWDPCSLDDAGYLLGCKPDRYCGVFRHPGADYAVARLHGRCADEASCLALSKHLPGGFDCYDEVGKLVTK